MSEVICHISLNKDVFCINQIPQSLDSEFTNLKGLLSSLYKSLDLDYPKFHKMDNLCKLGFIGVELLKQKVDLKVFKNDLIALHFQNASASLDTDWVHQQKINEKKVASPANFVYTLPNIVLGEIAIRNKWYGENLFLLQDKFDFDEWMMTNEVLFKQNKAQAVIGGWVEVLKEEFELELYLIYK